MGQREDPGPKKKRILGGEHTQQKRTQLPTNTPQRNTLQSNTHQTHRGGLLTQPKHTQLPTENNKQQTNKPTKEDYTKSGRTTHFIETHTKDPKQQKIWEVNTPSPSTPSLKPKTNKQNKSKQKQKQEQKQTTNEEDAEEEHNPTLGSWGSDTPQQGVPTLTIGKRSGT